MEFEITIKADRRTDGGFHAHTASALTYHGDDDHDPYAAMLVALARMMKSEDEEVVADGGTIPPKPAHIQAFLNAV